LIEQLVAPDGTPAQLVEHAEMMKHVMSAVAELPELQRDVFLMRVQGEFSFNEIAKTLNIPLNTALGRMHDAMIKLRKRFAEDPRI